MSTEIEIYEEQCGFSEDRSCSDQNFIVGQLCEKMDEKSKIEYQAFMDSEKAYERVDRGFLLQVLGIYEITGNSFSWHRDFL